MLPVMSLQEPPDDLLVREVNTAVVSSLKIEMQDNPCNDVQPLLCVVQLKADESFNKQHKEGYYYHTIGGNHSRQALQELLKENPQLQGNRQYTYRLCAVYLPMEATLARRLASKHNRAASYCHKMTTWDWVSSYI